jgi:DNA-binding MarR family transcriptional regulator
VTVNDYSILARLDREGPLPLGALAARLSMDRTTLSREIAPLVAAGLVDSAADDADRRRRMLALSAAGTARVHAARPLWARAQEEFERGFGAERAAQLVDELHAVVGAA